MNDAFILSELVRKLANVIRVGKIVDINKNNVRVQIGEAKTGWLPIISTAGKTSIWSPISKGELVAVFAPYGEFTQGFVLRSINYDDYKTPDNTDAVSFVTDAQTKVRGAKNCEISYQDGINIKNQDAEIDLSKNGIKISAGGASIDVGDGGIKLSFGSSSINLSDSSIDLNSNNISTTPPVCKCSGV